jgi:hypothetical protein
MMPMRRPPVDLDAALRGPLEPDQDVEERRLAAAGLAHDGHDLAATDGEVQALDGHHRVPRALLAKDLAQPAHLDVGVRGLGGAPGGHRRRHQSRQTRSRRSIRVTAI